MSKELLRMDAYYFGFESTGVIEIDRILSAVATAGKGSHHTAGWADPDMTVFYEDGLTHEQRIQDAADRAAESFKGLRDA